MVQSLSESQGADVLRIHFEQDQRFKRISDPPSHPKTHWTSVWETGRKPVHLRWRTPSPSPLMLHSAECEVGFRWGHVPLSHLPRRWHPPTPVRECLPVSPCGSRQLCQAQLRDCPAAEVHSPWEGNIRYIFQKAHQKL